jgi:hypothetical protein
VSNPCLADIAALVRISGPDDVSELLIALVRERDAAHVELAKALARGARLETDVDTARKGRSAWEGLYNERNALWRQATDKLDAVRAVLEQNGCDCDCDHGGEEHDADCERCLACRIAGVVGAA